MFQSRYRDSLGFKFEVKIMEDAYKKFQSRYRDSLGFKFKFAVPDLFIVVSVPLPGFVRFQDYVNEFGHLAMRSFQSRYRDSLGFKSTL